MADDELPGEVLAAITREMVRIKTESYGKGATEAKSAVQQRPRFRDADQTLPGCSRCQSLSLAARQARVSSPLLKAKATA